MRKLAALAGATALGLGLQSGAQAYTATAAVTFTFGGSNIGANSDQGYVSAAGPIPIPGGQPTNSTLLHTLTGANANSVYNQDFTSAAQCIAGAGLVPAGSTGVVTRKYGCRYVDPFFTPQFAAYNPTAVDSGPLGQASGTIIVTDTTLTGTLTIVNTSDEPTGATTTLVTGTSGPAPLTTRESDSIGDGFAGYNYRSADGSPFGNSWYGITNAGTYTLHLTGTFNSTTWTVTGGYATFIDPGFACQQGGLGGDARGTLCTSSIVAGSFNPDGSHLSWGMDLDGVGTLVVGPIPLLDSGGATTLATLSGVIATMSVDGGGNISTSPGSGEIRRAFGSTMQGCPSDIRYDTVGNALSCGSITAGALVVSGALNSNVDGDGVDATIDNCPTGRKRGAGKRRRSTHVVTPATTAGTCANNTGVAAQCDSDADGFGNRCDGDMNNNNVTNNQDYGLFREAARPVERIADVQQGRHQLQRHREQPGLWAVPRLARRRARTWAGP